MSDYKLPSISQVSTLTESQKIELLDHLFEPCESLRKFMLPRLFKNDKYLSYKELIEKARKELLWFLATATTKSKEEKKPVDPIVSQIIAAHPRLGASNKQVVKLSEHSSKEQASLNAASQEEKSKLEELNDKYELTFPGLRYVVFVNGRSREIIMRNMEQRILRGDIGEERKEAFNAMCDIALDRAFKLGAKL